MKKENIDQQDSAHGLTRRHWMKYSAATVASIAILPGVTLIAPPPKRSPEEAASSEIRWGLLVDVNRCQSGCDRCVNACQETNGLKGLGRPETDAQWIRKVEISDAKTGFQASFPMMCQHCESPPCVDVCPTGASMKRADGIVLVDKHICIGCRYCMMACPYKARSFVHETLTEQKIAAPRGKGTVEACHLCASRVDSGRLPACVEACSQEGASALVFGNLNDPQSAIVQRLKEYPTKQLRADLKLNPGVRYQGI